MNDQNTALAPKRDYETPKLIPHGTFEGLTQGGSFPGKLDASFPAGTDFSQLTFSK